MILKFISKLYLKAIGWKIKGTFPSDIKKCVIIAAPHTSNSDFIIGRAAFYTLGIPKVTFLIKKELFFFPMGIFLKAMGGYPVDRKKNTIVKDSIESLAKRKRFYLLITPEGTRKLVKTWKKGYYHISYEAKVPIVVSYLNYEKKEGGVGFIFHPTGNYEEDFQKITDFYKDKTAKFPENFNLSEIYRNK
ncbi:MAG: 1-acyl-sn-glycerol-3-phosphate acyltransferase [Bacteroidota bacterium]